MKFKIPTIDTLKDEGINVAGLFVGVIGGYAVQNFLMKERTAKDGTVKAPIIKDTVLFNSLGILLGLGVATTTSSPFLKFIGLGVATIFAIRTVNRVTDGLSGINGLNGGLKTILDKYVPKINGVAFDMPMGNMDYTNEPLMLPMSGYGDDMGRTAAWIAPGAVDIKVPTAAPNLTVANSGRHA